MNRLATTLSATLILTAGLVHAPDAAARCPRSAMVLGDSNIRGGLGREIEHSLERFGLDVVRVARSGSGLARPEFFDWIRTAEQLTSAYDPEIVIIMLGGNDAQSMRERGVRARFRTDAWYDAYARRLQALLASLGAGARRVVFLSPTNRRPRKLREAMKRVMAVQSETAAAVPNVSWVDTFKLTSDRRGRYRAVGFDKRGRRVKLRQSDGIHLTIAGARDLYSRLEPLLIAELLGGCVKGSRPVTPVHASVTAP